MVRAVWNADFMSDIDTDVIGKGCDCKDTAVDNQELVAANAAIRSHGVEKIGTTLRGYMGAMKSIAVGG